MDDIREIRRRYSVIKNSAISLKSSLDKKQIELNELVETIDDHIQARYVITKVQETTQQTFKDQVEILTSNCLKSVYGDNFEFRLNTEIKRNRVEFQPVVIDNGEEFSPKDDQGGGVRNVCGLALRIVMIILNQSERVVIMDEPFKALGKLTEIAGKMIKSLSEDLGFQFIIITHDERLTRYSDKHFLIEKIDGISKVSDK